jgi:hypothetical protein
MVFLFISQVSARGLSCPATTDGILPDAASAVNNEIELSTMKIKAPGIPQGAGARVTTYPLRLLVSLNF